MITFTKNNVDDMEAFKNDIREAIIEMVAGAIGPYYGDYNRFDEEIARKLDSGEISLHEARCAFAEAFYWFDLENLRVEGNSVFFRDGFNTEDTCIDGGYSLGEMVYPLLKKYSGLQVYGFGYIDYHNEGITYILISVDGNTVFADTSDYRFIMWLREFGCCPIYDFLDEMEDDEYSMDQLKEDISKFIKENEWTFTPEELLNKLGLDDIVKYLYPEV